MCGIEVHSGFVGFREVKTKTKVKTKVKVKVTTKSMAARGEVRVG